MRVIADTWYADVLGVPSIENVLARFHLGILGRHAATRGAVLWLCARACDVVVTTLGGPGTWWYLALTRIFPSRRRNLVILEFIPAVDDQSQRESSLKLVARRRIVNTYWRCIAGPALRRVLLRAQSLTRWETERNAAFFGISPVRFKHIPWAVPYRSVVNESAAACDGVLASGRAACDWKLVFDAAAGTAWPLTVVCSSRDRHWVDSLNADKRARVLCEIDRDEHAQLLAQSRVYVLALREASASSGQVRLVDAVNAGVAVVATNVAGLREYLVDGQTALVVEAGDAAGTRHAIDLLVSDEELRQQLVTSARESFKNRTQEDYVAAIRELYADAVHEAVRHRNG